MPLTFYGSGNITGTGLNVVANTGNISLTSSTGNVALRVNPQGFVSFPNRMGFHVQGFGSLSLGGNVTFGSTIFNYGNMVNISTGIVTIPITGIYMFGFTAIGNNTDTVYRFYFRKNGVTLGNGGDMHLRQDTNASGGEYATNGMYTFVWPFNAGDVFNLRYNADNSSTLPYGNNTANDDYPRFWGVFLG